MMMGAAVSFQKLIAGGHVSRDPTTCGGFRQTSRSDILRHVRRRRFAGLGRLRLPTYASGKVTAETVSHGRWVR
jgi:hypothetical protein